MSETSAATPATGNESCRIMVVDDSIFIRGMITRALTAFPEFKVVAAAGNGEQAIAMFKENPVDVIILDIEMPVMDGLQAIGPLKQIDPAVQIIMASTLTQRNADISMQAMSLGASDYLPKPTSARDAGGSTLVEDFNRDLIEKARAYGVVARRMGTRRKPAAGAPAATTSAPRLRSATMTPAAPMVKAPPKPIILRKSAIQKPAVIAIGSSTGGPQALMKVIAKMGKDLPQPIVITQHIPPFFTASLTKSISQTCGVMCLEAEDGVILKAGHYYIAPGDFHMKLVRKAEGNALHLVKEPPENYCRPSVDPMLRSVIEIYGGPRTLAVILTGMGHDGRDSCKSLVDAGGNVIAQDEATSVVWGMPGAVAEAGICSAVLPLDDIGSRVRSIALGGAL